MGTISKPFWFISLFPITYILSHPIIFLILMPRCQDPSVQGLSFAKYPWRHIVQKGNILINALFISISHEGLMKKNQRNKKQLLVFIWVHNWWYYHEFRLLCGNNADFQSFFRCPVLLCCHTSISQINVTLWT